MINPVYNIIIIATVINTESNFNREYIPHKLPKINPKHSTN